MTASTANPPLTESQVDAILTDAQNTAAAAAEAVTRAEAILRGEQLPTEGEAPITPELLAQLRQNAEHAALLVPAAEREQRAARNALKEARTAEIRAQILAEAESDLDGAPAIITALDAFEAALAALCGSIEAHNTRVAKWDRLMSLAGIQPIHGEGGGEGTMSHMIDGQAVTLGSKVYRPMRGAPLIAAVLHRHLGAYPRDFRTYNTSRELAHDGELSDSNGQLDLRTLIRKDA